MEFTKKHEMKKHEKTLLEAINEHLNHYNLKNRLSEIDIIKNWEIIFGKSIKKHTTKILLKKKLLVIYIDSSALKHELSFAKNKIIERINEHFKTELINEVLVC